MRFLVLMVSTRQQIGAWDDNANEWDYHDENETELIGDFQTIEEADKYLENLDLTNPQFRNASFYYITRGKVNKQ